MIGQIISNGPSDLTFIVVALIAAVPATLAAVGSWRNGKKLRTNHGKTIGEHVETASQAASDAKYAAELVALQLAKYKIEQAEDHREANALFIAHTEVDERNFGELRRLLDQRSQ